MPRAKVSRRVNDAVVAEIKGERARRGMTGKDVAALAGIPYRTYVRYESGERKLDLDLLNRIAHALGSSGPEMLLEAKRRDEAAFSLDVTRGEDLE